ncbi:toll/interleukin-1 receptor domain-containing protein [Pseudomonas sp. LF090]
MDSEIFEYDVALSFAGEDREYVQKVATLLKDMEISVFYDDFEKVNLWGKDLYTYLSEIYQKKSQYTVIFISEHYAKKQWTNHERSSAQARAFSESKEYILPVRFDETQIPGVTQTIGYISLKNTSPSDLAKLIAEKLKRTKFNRANALKAEVFSSILKNPGLMKAILSDDQDLAIELLAKEGNLEGLLEKMFESGALD